MTAAAKSGIDLTHIDADARPQDDLFEHVNGAWLADHAIPADRAVDGAFRTLYDQAEKDVRTIITDAAAGDPPPGSITRKIGDLYSSFMNADAVEAAGLEPIRGELDAVANAADHDELAGVLGSLARTGVTGAVAFYVDTDAKDSSRYLVHFTQSGLGLPDEAYYREDDYAEIREKYTRHIAAMFSLAELSFDADTVVDLERELAKDHWDVVKRRDADLSYNLVEYDELPDGFSWDRWIAGAGARRSQFEEIVVRQPSFVQGFTELWTERDLDDWKAWASWHILHTRAPYLTAAIVDENFAFYGRTLSGTEENRDRWKRAVSLVELLLGEAVGKLYVEKHFSPVAKERMQTLVANLIEAYRRSITDLEWMTPQTRQRALEKLGKFTPKIGYPDEWRDYSAVEIAADDLVGNYRSGYAAEFDRDLGKLGGPVDRGEWFMTPQTVNAYYNPGMNEIVFPAAILQPPFFDPDADDAANYGGIGAVIGHEIGHGFDDQGAKYDGDGNLENWWTDSDRDEFGKRTTALIAQYDDFEPKALPGHHVNGEFTIGENIGDLGGLSIAVSAYEIATEGTEPPEIDGLSGLQRVFFGWAQVWRTKARDEEAIRRLAIDPHSPPEFRCNGVVRNLDSFHEAFEVREGDALYLDPAQRVRIWS
ncbi:peptidase M13 [Rhodococcus rhodnii]|uniref:Neprilysin n=2 Tax=Rhodococcus rhodnii TaxID=38312 RepID=R7WQS2_9NOCA|nr:M13 family metallopeptidase [Rhodococcus rhodnii]EOM76304.1 neprilysin [Rhodococcus rhodnii LMG 5362]TXG89979.1 peptidase M13 [Rhodococcus rhodnii]